MSHTSIINSVVFSDVAALRSAIKELASLGVKCELLENAIPRAYYIKQAGMGIAPLVVKLTDGPYDVGLYQRQGTSEYEARADFYAGYVEKVLGVSCPVGGNKDQAKMGKLYQMYAVHAATRKAIQEGHQVSRVNQADGSVQLEVSVAA